MNADCFPNAPAEWPKVPISGLAEVNPRYPVRKGQEYPFVEMAAVGENFGGIRTFDVRKMEGSGLSRFKAGDTLFAKITPCPENRKVAHVTALSAELGLGSTEFIVLAPRAGCDSWFLYHLVCSHAVRGRAIARMEGSTGRQRVPEDVFRRRLLIPKPPRDEQAAIAHILDTLDAGIERIGVAISRAEELRRSLLTSLLSRGVGQSGRVRNYGSTPYAFANTPLGRLPAVWRLGTVGSEFDLQNGFTLNSNRRPRFRKRRYLRVANVQRDALLLDDIQELEAGDGEFAPRALKTDDLLVVEGHADRLQIGRCARVTEEAKGLTFQNHLFRLRANGGVLPYFACLWLNSAYAQRYWNARCATSSGLNTINQRMLKRLVIPVPPETEQRTITQIVSRQRDHIEALFAKQRALESLKSALLHDLLTGKVRVNHLNLDPGGVP